MSKELLKGFHLLIPAAGTASRMGKDTPKPYMKIMGKPVLRHTIEKFLPLKGLKGITVIINPEHEALYNQAVTGLKLNPFVLGATSRKSSVYNGIKSFSHFSDDEVLLIHDAARPLVARGDVENLLNAMSTSAAATLATPVTDTLERNNQNIPRDDIWSIQTPQAFRFEIIKSAHEKFADNDNFTDDAGLVRAAGHKVELIPASRSNFKITTPEDFTMAQKIISSERQTRIASGFDVHAFEKVASDRKLMLGGISIPHTVALSGHSDADVILHAITDALLGTINAGDIGTHFPPSDPRWKNADSAIFLKAACDMVNQKGGDIIFLDVTIMAEEPKIGPHRTAIQARVAEITGLNPENISIKATTTEGLGFTGRKEGIACQALATITLPVTN